MKRGNVPSVEVRRLASGGEAVKIESFVFQEKNQELQKLRTSLARMSGSGEEAVRVRGDGGMRQRLVVIERKTK